MNRIITVWRFIGKHKYLITLATFLFILTFIDENNFIKRIKNNREISQLNKEIKKYKDEFAESTRRLEELNSNPEALEKVAREKYLMKKADEDIFVFAE